MLKGCEVETVCSFFSTTNELMTCRPLSLSHLSPLSLSSLSLSLLCVWVLVCVCVHVYVVYEDTNLYNDMGMT